MVASKHVVETQITLFDSNTSTVPLGSRKLVVSLLVPWRKVAGMSANQTLPPLWLSSQGEFASGRENEQMARVATQLGPDWRVASQGR